MGRRSALSTHRPVPHFLGRVDKPEDVEQKTRIGNIPGSPQNNSHSGLTFAAAVNLFAQDHLVRAAVDIVTTHSFPLFVRGCVGRFVCRLDRSSPADFLAH